MTLSWPYASFTQCTMTLLTCCVDSIRHGREMGNPQSPQSTLTDNHVIGQLNEIFVFKRIHTTDGHSRSLSAIMTGANILISHESGSEEQSPIFGSQRHGRFRFTSLITSAAHVRYHGHVSPHGSPGCNKLTSRPPRHRREGALAAILLAPVLLLVSGSRNPR
jgi:hypothetical protein